MTIEKNSRQIPKVKKIISEKYYSDILYSHLQVISSRVNNERIIPKKEIIFSKLGETLNLTRQTVSKKFKNLIDLGLIIKEEDYYILPPLTAQEAFLIPQETLRKMVNTLTENTINIYVYLINRFYANKEKPFNFTIVGLKDFCGLGTKTKSNNYIITDILEILSKLNLINYSSTIVKNEEDGTLSTTYSLNHISLTI